MHDGSWSWVTLDKDTFPEITGKIHYEKDRRTCVAPVKLEPGKTYAVFLNSTKFTNFRDLEGRPAVPYLPRLQDPGREVNRPVARGRSQGRPEPRPARDGPRRGW